jgi:hypothetical protein
MLSGLHAAWEGRDLPLDKMVGVPYWCDHDHWMFDPWALPDGAENIHMHHHTRWAQFLFDNWRSQKFSRPAVFNWAGENVILAGRGQSLEAALPLLADPQRTARVIWMNSAIGTEAFRPDLDFAMCYEAAVGQQALAKYAPGRRLIAAPQVGAVVPSWPWAEIYGFVNWNKAPLNDFARHLFPNFPGLVECLGIATAAMHLAAKSGARQITLIGQDMTLAPDAPLTPENLGEVLIALPGGREVRSEVYYAQLAMACGALGFFVHKRTGARLVNCSADPLIGMDIFAGENEAQPLPWFEFDTLESHLGR